MRGRGRGTSRPPLGLGLALAAASACTILAPRDDPSRFFTITPIVADEAPTRSGRPLALGVGPINLPRHLDRPEMVTRVGANEVHPAKFDYWAGSLQRQFESALAQNLQSLLGAEQLYTYPWYPGSKLDYTVEVDVREFERHADGQAHLAARWRIRQPADGRVVRTGQSKLARAATADPATTAAALSALLGDLTREIAAGIRAAG
ncbi:MAG: PqiC family protein [Candidatus Binatia bacterium]